MRQRTQVINALRAHLTELGIAAAQGTAGLKGLLKIIVSDADERLPADAHASLVVLAAELQAMQTLVGSLEKRVMAQHRGNEASQRLETIPGIGFIGATAIESTVTEGSIGRSRGRPDLCAIWDFSEKGVRLVIPSLSDVPDTFVLPIKRNSEQRYHCRIVWRTERQLGVLFMSTIR
jgi:hypothetical protein